MASEGEPSRASIAGWTIRPAGAEDRRELQQIVKDTPEAASWIPELADGIGEGGASRVLVASQTKKSGGVVGLAAARVVADEAEILNVAVRPGLRRHGIGFELLKRLIAELSAAGARRIFLEVRESNRAAIALYEKHGFHRAGLRHGYYLKPAEDALVMEKRVAQH